jgi:hypothetical protein
MDFRAWRRKRRTLRVPSRLVARLPLGVRDVTGFVPNVSRNGILVRVPTIELGLPARSGLFAAARALTKSIGEVATVEMRPEDGEGTLVKEVRFVRIDARHQNVGILELGCEFIEPMTDEEYAQISATPLPAHGHETATLPL